VVSGPAALKQEGVSFLVVSQEANGSDSVPMLQCGGLVLALPMWPLDLQNDIAGRDDVGNVGGGEGLLELEAPLLGALLDELR
jgi:hypothetical protein